MKLSLDLLKNADLIFWDFDGVIKESVEVKSSAFEALFKPFGNVISAQVLSHHDANAGVSRLKKIPMYLEWAGIPSTSQKILEYCDQFSNLVFQSVIESPWVPGVLGFLEKYHNSKHFILTTATPKSEILDILSTLGIVNYFRDIFGAPTEKHEAISYVLNRDCLNRSKVLMVGDSKADLQAAEINNIKFLLRRNSLNKSLQTSYGGPQCDNFL